jgi:hypothetical protein
LDGYKVIKKEFWLKNKEKKWVQAGEDAALRKPPKEDQYGLGCFVLEK